MEEYTEMRKLIGEQIRKARKDKGKTIVTVAGELGVDQKNLSDIETGKSNFCIITFCRYATYLNMESIYLKEPKQ